MRQRAMALLLIICLILTVSPHASAAAVGSTVGYYYYTDIVTFLWDIRVNAINIGGRTLIDAESLSHYGFDVTWYAEKRRLELTDTDTQLTDDKANSGALLDKVSGKPGRIAGRYYHTDIVATLNGHVIESFNLGGRTFISAEKLRDFGYDVLWFPADRQLKISNPWADTDKITARWSLPLYSTSNTSGSGEINYFYLCAAQQWASPGNYDTYGSGSEALTDVRLSRTQPSLLLLSFSFYQYTHLKPDTALFSKLRDAVCAVGDLYYGDYIKEPASVRDALNTLLQVYINGERILISELLFRTGNGHADYTLVLEGLGSLRKNGIYSVAVLCNVQQDLDVPLPPPTMGLAPWEYAVKMMTETPYYHKIWEHETKNCALVYGEQSTPHGVSSGLWVFDKSDGHAVNLLSQTGLASYYGSHPALHGLSVNPDETTLSFSCDTEGKTYTFQADLTTAKLN